MNRYSMLVVIIIQLLVVVLVILRVWKRPTVLKNTPSPVARSKQNKDRKPSAKAEALGARETLEESLAKHRRQMEEELARYMRQQKSTNN